MPRKTGFLAQLNNIPPLVFRFQFNPELMSDKKSYKYDPGGFKRKIDPVKDSKSSLVKFYRSIEDTGPYINNTQRLEPVEGDQRTISLDFHLDASKDLPDEARNRYDGTIQPDLAVLRSFVYPTYKLTEIQEVLGQTGIKDFPKSPPELDFVYGSIRLACVMTDLNIKITAFQEDGSPLRADVSLTLKEQTLSTTPIIEYLERFVGATRSLMGLEVEEVVVASPIGFLYGLFE